MSSGNGGPWNVFVKKIDGLGDAIKEMTYYTPILSELTDEQKTKIRKTFEAFATGLKAHEYKESDIPSHIIDMYKLYGSLYTPPEDQEGYDKYMKEMNVSNGKASPSRRRRGTRRSRKQRSSRRGTRRSLNSATVRR